MLVLPCATVPMWHSTTELNRYNQTEKGRSMEKKTIIFTYSLEDEKEKEKVRAGRS